MWRRSKTLPQALFLPSARFMLLAIRKLVVTFHRSCANSVRGTGDVIAASEMHMNAAPRIGFAVGTEVTKTPGDENSALPRKTRRLVAAPTRKCPGRRMKLRTPVNITFSNTYRGMVTMNSKMKRNGVNASRTATQRGCTIPLQTKPALLPMASAPSTSCPGPSALWTAYVIVERIHVEFAIRNSKLLKVVKLPRTTNSGVSTSSPMKGISLSVPPSGSGGGKKLDSTWYTVSPQKTKSKMAEQRTYLSSIDSTSSSISLRFHWCSSSFGGKGFAANGISSTASCAPSSGRRLAVLGILLTWAMMVRKAWPVIGSSTRLACVRASKGPRPSVFATRPGAAGSLRSV
mmetsp:Transcript_20669/g.48254  ORF Transcript_20669/g.48254 Transcript_20669/m.48254 type:complete len:346 (-) Transcript_20669:467-1504(-)